jgi:hypothetical protein
MPTQVEIPDQGIVEFPDEMTPEDIKGIIQNKFYGQNAPSLPTQVVQPKMGLADMLFDSVTAQNLRGEVQDVLHSIPGYVGRGEFAPEAGAQSAPIVTEQAQDPLAQVAKGVFGAVGAMVPKSLDEAAQMLTLPRPSDVEGQMKESEALGEAWRGEHGLEEQAKAITGTALQSLPLAGLPFAKSPLRATPKDLALVEQLQSKQPAGGEITNAEQISKPTQVHGDVQYSPRPEEGAGPLPSDVGGEGVQTRGQRETLQQAPQEVAAVPPEQPAPVPEAEAPTTAAPEIQSITSIKNAQVDTERSTRGLPPVVEPARKAFGETWEQATKKIDENPAYPDQLIEELKSKPRALNDVEDATLLHRQVDLQNQFQKSTESLFKAREVGDEVGAMEHDARVNALSDQLLELYDVGKKAGTETGRGLAARKLLAAEDFSLANMVTQKRAANPTIDVETATKSAQSASSKISAAQTAYDAYETSPKAEAYRKRLKSLTEQYKTRTAQGDFATRKPQKILLDKEGEALKADLERSKKEWLTALQKDRAANRTPSQKFWDRFVGVERAMKLSSDVVLAKLSAAAVVREAGLTPLEEAAGAGIGKVLPGLAKRAPREGGFSLDAELKAKSEMFTSGMKDAWQNLKMKQTDLDVLYSGRKPGPPTEFYDYLGYLHGALKAPIKRAEFARSLTKRMRWAVENGQDLNNVNTMRELSEEAYVDANRSIFMQDNVVASTFTGALRQAEMSKKAPNLGPAIARIGRFLVPIVKIPTNIVGEVATGIHGVATGGSRAAVAYLKGIDSLPPAQADSIMRQLKKGSIGNALILTGYYTANNIGGFYHDQDKRTPEDVQPGRYRIGNVDLPASAGHSTGAMLLNIGATVKRVQDERIKKSEAATKGLSQGILAAGGGLAHEIPFVPAATGITDALGSPHGFEKYVNGMIQSTTVPALSSHIAKILDTPGSLPSNILQEPVKRKPTNPLEAVKMGIPGLRQTVPERKEKISKNRPR